MTSDKACQMPIDQLVEELWAEIPNGTRLRLIVYAWKSCRAVSTNNHEILLQLSPWFPFQIGLSQEEVDRKLKEFGHNEFEVKDDESIIQKYLGQFKVSGFAIVDDVVSTIVSIRTSPRLTSLLSQFSGPSDFAASGLRVHLAAAASIWWCDFHRHRHHHRRHRRLHTGVSIGKVVGSIDQTRSAAMQLHERREAGQLPRPGVGPRRRRPPQRRRPRPRRSKDIRSHRHGNRRVQFHRSGAAQTLHSGILVAHFESLLGRLTLLLLTIDFLLCRRDATRTKNPSNSDFREPGWYIHSR